MAAENERTLDFLKIWHNVFSKNLEYIVDGIQDDSTLDVESVHDDQNCLTGRWLSQQPENLVQLAAFKELARVHHDYHGAAAELLKLFQAGKPDAVRAVLETRYLESSNAVCRAIDHLSEALTERGIYPQRFASPNTSQHKSIWSDSLEIGILEIDRHHHAIATLIDEVLVNSDIQCATSEGLNFLHILSRMILKDIETENDHLAQLSEEGVDCSQHLRAHDMIRSYLQRITEQARAGQAVSFGEVGSYLANWYIDHLVLYDLDIEQRRITSRKVTNEKTALHESH